MRRLFCPSLAAGVVCFDDDTARHVRVLRLKEGDAVELFNSAGTLAKARIVGPHSARVESLASIPAPVPALHLIQGLPKAAKSELIVRMATELGVASITFVRTAHCAYKGRPKLERWQRIAREACRQSERLHGVRIEYAEQLDAALDDMPEGASTYYAFARGGTAAKATGPQRVVAVGPEGGFSEAERAHFERAGFAALTLGRHILRAETAAAAAVVSIAHGGPSPTA